MVRALFSFPNPVNEVAARSVAGLVTLLCAVTLIVRSPWLLIALAVGFWLRVLTGPTLSPFGQLATRVIAPAIGHPNPVPGPPKRFAQGIGTTFATAAVLSYYLGSPPAAWILVGLITLAAVLESAFAICLGCIVFGRLQAWGVIPASVCQACNDIRLRAPASRQPGSARGGLAG